MIKSNRQCLFCLSEGILQACETSDHIFWADGIAEVSKSDGCTSVFQLADLESTLSPKLITQRGGNGN